MDEPPASDHLEQFVLQPGDQVGNHIFSVGLVEYFMTSSLIHLQRDVIYAGIGQPAEKDVNQRELSVYRVHVTDNYVDRQIAPDGGHTGRIRQLPGAGEHRLRPLYVQAEPT